MKLAYYIGIRVFAIFGVPVFCLIVWYIVAVTWRMPIHNYQLKALQRYFRSAVLSLHPIQSEFRAEMAEFGNFGNSNHCDYLAGEFRSSSLPREIIMQAYTGATILSFDKISRLPVEVYFTDEDAFTHPPWEEWLSKYLPYQSSVANKDTFLVFAASDLHPPNGDIRCH